MSSLSSLIFENTDAESQELLSHQALFAIGKSGFIMGWFGPTLSCYDVLFNVFENVSGVSFPRLQRFFASDHIRPTEKR